MRTFTRSPFQLLAIVALFGTATGTRAQGDSLWTLERCIDQAINYNLEIKRQEVMVRYTGQDQRQSKLNVLPNLNGVVEHQLGSGRVLDRGTYTWKNANVSQGDLGLQTELTIFNGLQNLNEMRRSQATYMMNQELLEAMKDRVTIDVMTGYLNLLRNRELVGVAENKVEITREQVRRMERLVEVGNESRGKLLEVRAQLSAANLALTQAINDREIARLTLMHSLNLTDQEHFGIRMPVLPDPATVGIPPLDSVFEYALANLPQIKSAQYNIESMEKSLAVQRGQRSPRVYARGVLYSNYSNGLVNPRDPDPFNPTMDYPLNQQVTDNQYRQLSMGVQLPFFNKWQVQTEINKAKLELQDAEYEYSSTVLALQQTIQQIHAEALAARDNYASALEAVANSDEAFRFAEERFRVGTGTALELQEARNQLYQTTSDLITSKYTLIIYLKVLDYYMGEEYLI